MRTAGRLLIATLCALLLPGADNAELTERQRALHVLNRLAMGPRPGDVDRVVRMGVDNYIAQQLHPERIEDRAVDAKLQKYQTLRMSERDLLGQFAEMRQMRRDQKSEREDAILRRESSPMKRNAVALELTSARLDRAIESNRQLNEVMVDFWMNHFNVFAGKGADRVLIATYERDTIRPHIWGNFDELLMATAKSPAMLVYLDNARSIAPPENRVIWSAAARRRFPIESRRRDPIEKRQQAAALQMGGLNENYARELLELHTLGVDAGYTQTDVTELARLLTGWSVARPNEGGSGFKFRAALHDARPKTVLGQKFPAGGGLGEGEQMIRYLAHHPSTARFIATKLCQRLVSDEPPPQLVHRVAKRFLETGGDLRATVTAVITSEEFFDPRHYRAKVKTPFEFVVSAVRATGATSENPLALAKILRDMGQPLYFAQPPTGYSDAAEPWVNTGAIMNRLNFAMALAGSKVPGVRPLAPSPPRPLPSSIDAIAQSLIGGELSVETRRTIAQQLEKELPAAATPTQKSQLIAGLILGSPEFQRQ